MNIKCVLASGISLICAAPVCAAFVGIVSEPYVGDGWVENGYGGLTTYRVYALFDGQGDDGVLSVHGLNDLPLSVRTQSSWFFNDRAGSCLAPIDLTEFGHWSNQWDTYVTINVTDGVDNPVEFSFCNDFGQLCNDFGTLNGGWFILPDEDASRADEDGRVLIAQLTIGEGSAGIELLVNLLLRDGTHVTQQFACTGPDTAADCPPSCPFDVNLDFAVNNADLIAVLAAWGECNGCPEDLNCDFGVGLDDLLAVLAAWGPCES